MAHNTQDLWKNFQEYYYAAPELGFALDISRMNFSPSFISDFEGKIGSALQAMVALEGGAIANRDEQRMVGHFWLRDAAKAPTKEIRQAIEGTLESVVNFARDVHGGQIKAVDGGKFAHLLVIGIGGSALGPQLVTRALGTHQDKLSVHFFDNTDPDGMNRVLLEIPDLARTMCVVISKSGGTKETRNGQLVAKAAFTGRGLKFAGNFVAVTGEGSELDKTALSEGWLARFPMWDWVGGRYSLCLYTLPL